MEEVDHFLLSHRDYLAEHYAAGDFIASGPQNPRVGGAIMIKASDHDAVNTIISKDPFNVMEHMFCMFDLDDFTWVAVRSTADEFEEIATNHTAILPGKVVEAIWEVLPYPKSRKK